MAVMNMAIRHYGVAVAVSLPLLSMVLLSVGLSAVVPVLALAVVEVTFSFENAIINSQVLGSMSRFWRKMFLTVGIATAVFGVRVLLPLVLVGSTTGKSIGTVLQLALHHPDQYAEALHGAYPVLAAFGGIFLLMIALQFFCEGREVLWLKRIERPLVRLNRPWLVPLVGATFACIMIWFVLAPDRPKITVAALLGLLTYVLVKGLSALLSKGEKEILARKKANGVSGLMQFLYLELLDASFSFDGVIAAFAITKDVLLIAVGLGIGALFVRSMTVHLLEQGTLTSYRYLVHGAHYAIGVLASLLLLSVRIKVPELLSGGLGLFLIALAFRSSRRHNRRTDIDKSSN